MEPSKDNSAFEFIVSTPTYNASVQKDVQRAVRKHVMLRFKSKNKRSPSTVTILQHEALVNYLGSRQRRCQSHELEKDTVSSLEDVTFGRRISQDTCMTMVVSSFIVPNLSKTLEKLAMSSKVLPGHKETLPSLKVADMPVRVLRTSPTTDWLGTGTSDPFIAYPIALGSRAKQLINYLFDDQVGRSPPYRDIWFRTSLVNVGAFHQLLCLAAAYLNSIQKLKNIHDTKESLAHHALAIHFVKKQLQNEQTAISSGTISAITGFACYYHILGNFKAWKEHILALKEIIRLRGGFATVYQDESLSILITSVDISGSCDLDATPNFPFPDSLKARHSLSFPTKLGALWYHSPRFSRLKSICGIYLTGILDDLVLETRNLRFEIARTQGQICFDCLYIVHNISPLLHRLLSIPSKSTTSKVETVPEVFRLTCILYIMTIRFAFGIFTARGIPQLEKLKSILIAWEKSGTVRDIWEGIGSDWLQVWIFAIGFAASQNVVETNEWFQRRFARALRNMEWTKEEFTEGMSEYLWVEGIHGSIFT